MSSVSLRSDSRGSLLAEHVCLIHDAAFTTPVRTIGNYQGNSDIGCIVWAQLVAWSGFTPILSHVPKIAHQEPSYGGRLMEPPCPMKASLDY
jgi:hypothetical protein